MVGCIFKFKAVCVSQCILSPLMIKLQTDTRVCLNSSLSRIYEKNFMEASLDKKKNLYFLLDGINSLIYPNASLSFVSTNQTWKTLIKSIFFFFFLCTKTFGL